MKARLDNRIGISEIERLARIGAWEEVEAALAPDERTAVAYEWRLWGRPNQQTPPGDDWRLWLILAGRGWGKTRTGAEFIREQARRSKHLILAARTAADLRGVMIEGESGILATSPTWERPDYQPSKRLLVWPNGARAMLLSADEPDLFRGPQCEVFWADELATWRRLDETWSNLELGHRLGARPRGVITTTPRPTPLLRRLLKSPDAFVTRAATYENAGNLPEAFINQIRQQYEGTRLGRQELHGEILEDVEGALWNRAQLDLLRVESPPDAMQRVVVAVDPAVSSGAESDMTGIIVAGLGVDGRGYILGDWSCKLSPLGWAQRAVEAARKHEAVAIVAEVNNGGDLVEQVIRQVDPFIRVIKVRAAQGKSARAEPVAALYEQGRISHVGPLDALEDQLCQFTPQAYFGDGSPDRADALVWALSDLFLAPRAMTVRTFDASFAPISPI